VLNKQILEDDLLQKTERTSHEKTLNNEQRQRLSFLLVEGRNQRQIAESLNVYQSTINRELKQHCQKRADKPIKAQFCCDAKRPAKQKRTVLTPKRNKEIPFPLEKHWSPEQIAGRMTLEGKKDSFLQCLPNGERGSRVGR
jgi:IS30 family transposase